MRGLSVPAMSKNEKKTTYSCSQCGWVSPKWAGRCGRCQAWGSLSERPAAPGNTAARGPSAPAVSISAIAAQPSRARSSGLGELDRVLGGGLVGGAVVLLAGEPGVGKSTLLLEVAARAAQGGSSTLYVSGEESAPQVRLRAERTGAVHNALLFDAECD